MDNLGDLLDGMQVIQSDLFKAMPFRCNILRASESKNDYGRTPQTFAPINLTPVPCSYQAVKGSEKDSGGEETAIIGYIVGLPVGTDVTAKDRIAIAAQGLVEAMTLEVESVGQDGGVGVLASAQRII